MPSVALLSWRILAIAFAFAQRVRWRSRPFRARTQRVPPHTALTCRFASKLFINQGDVLKFSSTDDIDPIVAMLDASALSDLDATVDWTVKSIVQIGIPDNSTFQPSDRRCKVSPANLVTHRNQQNQT